MPFIAAPPKAGTADVYAPTGWDAGFRAALHASGSVPLRLQFSGDSITQGASVAATADFRSQSFPHLVRQALISRHGLIDGGEFFNIDEAQNGMVVGWHSPSYVGSAGAGVGPWKLTATYGGTEDGFLRRMFFPGTAALGAVGTEYLTFYAPPTTRRLVLYDWAPRTAVPFTWQYVLNPANTGNLATGAVTVTYNANGSAITKRTLYDAATPIPLTVYFGGQSGSQAMQLVGMAAYNDPDRGLHFSRICWSGKTLGHVTRADLLPTDKPAVLFQDSQHLGFPMSPHLLVMTWGVNDLVEGDQYLSPSRYRRALFRCLEAYRSGRRDGSVILMAPYYSVNPAYGDSGGFGNRETWGEYLRAMRDVAETYRCAFVNIHARWGPNPLALGFTSASTDAHPSPAGHQDMANALMGLLQ